MAAAAATFGAYCQRRGTEVKGILKKYLIRMRISQLFKLCFDFRRNPKMEKGIRLEKVGSEKTFQSIDVESQVDGGSCRVKKVIIFPIAL